MKKKFAAKRRDFYKRCIKTQVNKRKSKQDLQNTCEELGRKTNEVLKNTPCEIDKKLMTCK